MKINKKLYEEMLNGFDIPAHDKKSNGGRINDNVLYGSWLRRNDKIAFEVGYNEWKREREILKEFKYGKII